MLLNSSVIARQGRGEDMMLLAIEDITEKKHAMEEIKKLNVELEERVLKRTGELTAANLELEAFSYSVAHDLRAPLRGTSGFAQILLEEYNEKLDARGKDYLQRICLSSQRMGQLIDDLLSLSRLARDKMLQNRVDMTRLAESIAAELKKAQPERHVDFAIAQGIEATGDENLIRIILLNLLNNSWKFTSKHSNARITFGMDEKNGEKIYWVRDDGVGFDMKYVDTLFGVFKRLHSVDEFQGTGIGLAIVQRIIRRHGGRIWVNGEVEKGATFYFTLGGPSLEAESAPSLA
jgi:light-regulated signal transduction histidine kinase (bacteriophytochrome)